MKKERRSARKDGMRQSILEELSDHIIESNSSLEDTVLIL